MLFGCAGFRISLTAHPNPSRKREGRIRVLRLFWLFYLNSALCILHSALNLPPERSKNELPFIFHTV